MALRPADVLVFLALETLGACALIGNVTLIVVLVRFRYLARPSFVLILNLAIADVLHAVVTTSYFYPPIVLKYNHVPRLAGRIYTVVDWTAWGITVTNMSAICLDRLIAILLFTSYVTIVTSHRVKMFSVCCWSFFVLMNASFFAFNLCCIVRPKGGPANFYSFGYDVGNTATNSSSNHFNIYPRVYLPIEVIGMVILGISNPITLIQLWRRHRKKATLRLANNLLLEVSHSVTVAVDGQESFRRRDQVRRYEALRAHQAAARRRRRQQRRVFIQIGAVTVIFFLYMIAYYLFYYILSQIDAGNIMPILHSFLYSTTHMINPVVHFWLNREMRGHLLELLRSIFGERLLPQPSPGSARPLLYRNPTSIMSPFRRMRRQQQQEVMIRRTRSASGGSEMATDV